MEPEQGAAAAGESFLTPHRAPLVLSLGVIALLFNALSCACCALLLCIGVPLAVVAWVFAEQDLRGMRAGTVDPTGRASVVAGKTLALISLALAALYVVLVGAIALIAFLRSVAQR